MLERAVASVPVFLLLTLFLPACLVVPKFERMFREMECNLPLTTTLVLSISHILTSFWYVAAPAAVGVVWVFFSWGCKRRARMWCLAAFALVAFLIAVGIGMAGLYLPFPHIMEKIGE
ncbi:MAG: hypothetical protein NTW87_04255 [Planctomycetota bacterium]|nr:hypothetical protein [Planctomycetota bacterium]